MPRKCLRQLKKDPKRSQRGQIVVEYTLMLVAVIGLSSFLISSLREMEVMKQLTFEPFAKIDGMIQCGVWEPCGLNVRAPNKHSNTAARVLSLDPERGP